MSNYSFIVYLSENTFVIKTTLKECSQAVKDYIDENMLGAREFYDDKAGLVLHPTEGKYAKISYNGRIWHYSDDMFDRKEFTEEQANQKPIIKLQTIKD